MGHNVNSDREYELLRRQMDRHVSGVPESPVILEILKRLYAPEEAALARKIPLLPAKAGPLARKLGMPEDELRGKLTDLARRGLMFDFMKDGERYYGLPPILGGVYEYIMMRKRGELPIAEIARLFDEYMEQNETFTRTAYQGETPFARAFVREESLPASDHAEILDYERIGQLVETASHISVALCSCRHKNSHLGKACERPQRTCLSLNAGAESMIHSGISEPIGAPEALRIIEESKALGLAQVGDNVQHNLSFICNCCRCCCTLTKGVRTLGIQHAIVSSNWMPIIDAGRCKGCAKCIEACPVHALSLAPGENGKMCAVQEPDLCLGCGVCYTLCKAGAIRMTSRPQRVFTPETTFDMIGHMAIERGKVAGLLFEDPERVTHRVVGRLLRLLEQSPPWKAAMAIRPLRSAFLNSIFAFSKEIREEKAKRTNPAR